MSAEGQVRNQNLKSNLTSLRKERKKEKARRKGEERKIGVRPCMFAERAASYGVKT